MSLQSTLGDGACTFVPPFDDAELARLANAQYGGGAGRSALERIGADLFNTVFVDEVGTRYREGLVAAKRDGPLRIVLTLQPDELHQYPWELMNDGERFLAAAGHTQLVRRIGLTAPATRHVGAPLRVLVAVSDAIDVAGDLDIRAELACMASALGEGDAYLEIQPAVRHVIQARLREEAFDVLHFSGHGAFARGEGCLCFEKENGCADALSAAAFASLMEARSVPVVVLSACESGVGSKKNVFTGVAHALVRSGVPAVVAMRSSLSDAGAADLVRDFYGSLRLDFDVVAAVTEARRALFADRLDWDAPVLYTLHVDSRALEKASGARETPADPHFRLGLGLAPNVVFHLEFPMPLQFTKRPEQVPLGDALVASSPQVVTVDGPPGSGKTAIAGEMARRAAQQYRGGVLGLDCRTAHTLDAILVKVNETFLEPWNAQVDLTQPWGRKALSSALGQRPFLIVLDNFDSVLDQGREEFDRIVAFLSELPAPSKALVTSRERLDIGQRVHMDTLDRWPFALLLARAGNRRGIAGFDQDLCDRVELVVGDPSRADEMLTGEERRIFDEAHVKLGGLPFAAEIFMGLVAEGESIVDLLSDLRPVHERMTDLLDLSFNRLSEGARETLVLMSVFSKPVKRDAVRAVCHRDDWEDSLEELIRSSLVSSNRYSLHPLVREYAAAKALDRSALREAHRRAAEYFLTEDDIDPPTAIDHFHAAEEWARVVELTNTGVPMLFSLGLWTEAKARLLKAVESARLIGDKSGERESLSSLGTVSHALGDLQDALRYHEAALAIAREVADTQGEGLHLSNMATVYLTLGNTDRATDYILTALAVARQTDDRRAEQARLNTLAMAYVRVGRAAEAIDLCREALQVSQEIGDRVGEASSWGNLGICLFDVGRIEDARECYLRSYAIATDLLDWPLAGRALNNLGNAVYVQGRLEAARDYHERALSLARDMSDRPGEMARSLSLGNDLLACGEVERALELFDRSLLNARAIGDPVGEAKALCNAGLAHLELGRLSHAGVNLESALMIAREVRARAVEEGALGNLGMLHLQRGDLAEAAAHFRQALDVAHEINDMRGGANWLGKLGALEMASGDTNSALRRFLVALALSKQAGDKRGEAAYLDILGRVLTVRHEYDRALACYLLAVQVGQAIGDPRVSSREANIEELKHKLGEEEFARLLEHVEPNKESIVDEMLKSIAQTAAEREGEDE